MEANQLFFLNQKTLLYIKYIFIFFLLPYLILSFFSFPSTDDFSYANYVLEYGIWGAQKYSYISWSGRYTSNLLLSINPVAQKWIFGFPLVPITLIILLFLAIKYLLTSFLISFFNIKNIDPLKISVTSLIFLNLYLNHLPLPSQAFYWLAGSITYILPIIIVSFLIAKIFILFKFAKIRSSEWVLFYILSFVVVGFNETIMLQYLGLVFITNCLWYLKYKKISLNLFSTFIITTIGSAIVILAPGNKVRTGYFPDAHRPFYAIYRTVGSSIEHLIQFLNLPILFLIPIIIIITWILRPYLKSLKFKNLSTKWILISLALTMFSSFFPALWAMGGNPPARVDNTTYFWFLIHWCVFWIFWCLNNFERHKKLYDKLNSKFDTKKILIFSFFMMLLWKNNIYSWQNLFISQEFHSEWKSRMNESEKIGSIEENQIKNVKFKKLKYKPYLIFNEDLSNDPEDWSNKAWAQYFNLNQVQVVEE